MASEQPLLLSVRRKLLAPLPEGTTQADRDGLWMFYAARTEPVWVDKNGWTPKAVAAIEEIKRADDWGLQASAFEIPVLAKQAPGAPPSENALVDAELGLSLAALKYARYARGGRIEDPATQLSSYLDRKPTLRHPLLVMEQLAASNAPGEYLRTAASPACAVRKAASAVSGTPRRWLEYDCHHPDEGLEALPGNDAQGHRTRARAPRRSRRRRCD